MFSTSLLNLLNHLITSQKTTISAFLRNLFKSVVMEKVKVKRVLMLILLIVLVISCDKTKRASNQLIKKGRWTITELRAGTTEFTKLPKWQIYSCPDPENSCPAKWEHQAGSATDFYWKFYNIGGDFDFYVDTTQADKSTMAYAQCQNFSGHYKVKESKSKSFHFESEEVVGYPGKLVTIKIESE